MLQRAITSISLFFLSQMLSLGVTIVVAYIFINFQNLFIGQSIKKAVWFIYLFLTASFYFAATVECILILQFTIANVRHYYNQDKGFKIRFPYSVLLSAIGTVFAILGCITSVIVYHKSQNEDAQRERSTRSHEISLFVEEQELSTRNENY